MVYSRREVHWLCPRMQGYGYRRCPRQNSSPLHVRGNTFMFFEPSGDFSEPIDTLGELVANLPVLARPPWKILWGVRTDCHPLALEG